MEQKRLFESAGKSSVPSSAAGLTSDEALSQLATRNIALRDIEGAPIGDNDAILRLSMPPYFTACPNPFLDQLLGAAEVATGKTSNIPAFASDVAAGKSDPLYFLHYYSTKVPPEAILPFILHYTEPGEVILDGFCGTGMTGVAAQLCSDASRVAGRGKVGPRRAILSDLSPAAAFIAAGTNAAGVLVEYLDVIEDILTTVEQNHSQLLQTRHVGWSRGTAAPEERVNRVVGADHATAGTVEFVVWSDVFFCSSCGTRITFWDLVFRGPGKAVPDEAPCPTCKSIESLNTLQRSWITRFDPELGITVHQAEQVPVLINYRVGTRRFEKTPDSEDLEMLYSLEATPLDPSPPVVPLPQGYNTQQPIRSHGFSHVHHFFTRRNLALLSSFWAMAKALSTQEERNAALYVMTGAIQRICRLNRYMPNHDRHVGPLSGTLYVAPLTAEIPATNYMRSRIKDIRTCAGGPRGVGVAVGVQSATDLRNVPDSSVDFVFTDPPFGANLNYSELNILVEAWLGLRTNSQPEAIVNAVQNKGMVDYQQIMTRCFEEYARVLRSGRWMVVEFHNSSNAVWAAIQEAIGQAGFVVADVRTLDKKKGTTKQLSYASAVKQDLVISAYKPNDGLEERFRLEAGVEEGVWDFVRTHLKQLPVFVSANGQAEIIAERQNYLLFDRMVAFHVQRGVTVPLSAAEFYARLAQRFSERDGMYFLPDQVAEYDKKRMTVREVLQLQLVVTDESSAIQWLRQQLTGKPQTFQELHPQFLREIGGWQKHERSLELSELLEQNFLRYEGQGEVPNQIHSYLSTNYKELRNLAKDDPALRAKAKDRWYVPDPNKASDLEKLREKALLREFEEYRSASERRLKVFRLEAVRAGFKKAWQERDYSTIIAVAQKIPEAVLQEDPKLLMWYDQAVTRTEKVA